VFTDRAGFNETHFEGIAMELIDKIQRTHGDMFRRMLDVEVIPEKVLVKYFELKKMTDKVDGRLTAGDLAKIAIAAGFDPETMSFPGSEDLSKGDDEVVEEAIIEEPALECLDKDKPTAPADKPTGAADKPTAPLTPGTAVQVFYDGEILIGKIVGVPTDDDSNYQIETERGDTIDAEKDDIEEI